MALELGPRGLGEGGELVVHGGAGEAVGQGGHGVGPDDGTRDGAGERSPAYGFELPVLLCAGFRSIIDELHAELGRRGHPDLRPAHGFALQAIGPGGATAAETGRWLGISKQAAGKTADHGISAGGRRRLDGTPISDVNAGPVTVTFAGCGDAFGSGGRFQACIHLQHAGLAAPVLLDCGADLLIAEAYYWDKAVPHHLRHADLVDHERELSARRIVLTHMSADMLASPDGGGRDRDGQDHACHEAAHDGLIVQV